MEITKRQWLATSRTDQVEVIDLPDRYISRSVVVPVTRYWTDERMYPYGQRTESSTCEEE